MPANEYHLVVRLPKSDTFHTTDDHHQASVAEAVIRVALREHGLTDIDVQVIKNQES
jgi:3-oxoacyl-(acyl-carrier-protein) synthase